MLFNSDCANNTILSFLFFYFLIIDLYLLISAVNTHISNPISELVISIRIPSKEEKAEMETYPVIAEITISGQCISRL